MSTIELSIPARTDLVHVVRSVAAATGAFSGLSYDDLEDLRLAVDEACAYLLAMCTRPSTMRLHVSAGDGSVEMVAAVHAPQWGPPPDGPEHELIWTILAALTDGAGLERTSEGPAIRFTKRAH